MLQTIYSLISPKKFYAFVNTILPWLTLIFILTCAYGIIGGLILAPADAIQGEGFRILYVHAPCAFLSLFIYAVMGICAVLVLVFRLKLASIALKQSTSIGAIFTLLALVTGSLWGKPMWGTWWIWDARLTSELILLFIYLGLLLFQQVVADKRSADQTIAILTLVGCIDLPIIHYSVNWWNTLHQGATLRLFKPSAIDASMLYPLLSMLIAFIAYYGIVLLLRMRYELTAVQQNHHWLSRAPACN